MRIIENVNIIIATYETKDLPEALVIDPKNGSAAFGSAIFGWAFTITKFADTYSKKFGVER